MLQKSVLYVFIILSTLIFSSTVSAIPLIDFVNPTPDNNAETLSTSFIVNVSITEPTLKEIKYNWNSTNYTLYNDSLLFFMNFDNRSTLGENATLAVDISKYSRNATISGNIIWNATGKYSGAYRFGNGSITTSSIFLNNLPTFTFAGWIYAEATGSRIGFFGQNDAIEFGFIDANTIMLWTANGGSISWTINSTLFPLNTWNHVAVVGQNTTSPNLNFYLNGISRATGGNSATNFGTSNYNFSIGGGGVFDAIGNNFTGMIDNVMVFNYSLSSSEIYQLYTSSLTKYNSTTWNLQINQSKNATDTLGYAAYTYSASAMNTSNSENATSTRTINIVSSLSSSSSVPEFSDYALIFILISSLSSFFYIRSNPKQKGI